MTLEFEQLASEIELMVQQVSRRQNVRRSELAEAMAQLDRHASSWSLIAQRMERAANLADEKFFRAAEPLHTSRPLNQGIAPPDCPSQATLVACDGSQIVPDRHAPFLYYLINVGGITYYHGSALPPDIYTLPVLRYPQEGDRDAEDGFTANGALVNLRRDLAEITALDTLVSAAAKKPRPHIALLDQRLLYWPVAAAGSREGSRVVEMWQETMTSIRQHGAWLVGYIDRPGKRSVLAMLHALHLDEPGFDIHDVYLNPLYHTLTDTHLFDALLQMGERSIVFKEISQHNNSFRGRDPENEVCFFYLKTGAGQQQLARVDIPLAVAREEEVVGQLHALLYDQCQILGNYPYVITRADEIAVVGRREQEELENRIANRLAGAGIETAVTAKQQSKVFARGAKTRYEGF